MVGLDFPDRGQHGPVQARAGRRRRRGRGAGSRRGCRSRAVELGTLAAVSACRAVLPSSAAPTGRRRSRRSGPARRSARSPRRALPRITSATGRAGRSSAADGRLRVHSRADGTWTELWTARRAAGLNVAGSGGTGSGAGSSTRRDARSSAQLGMSRVSTSRRGTGRRGAGHNAASSARPHRVAVRLGRRARAPRCGWAAVVGVVSVEVDRQPRVARSARSARLGASSCSCEAGVVVATGTRSGRSRRRRARVRCSRAWASRRGVGSQISTGVGWVAAASWA